jgi:hypothetical protein
MGRIERRDQDSGTRSTPSRRQLCCVFWCREPAAIAVPVNGREHLACRKHAAFIKAGKLDWFER